MELGHLMTRSALTHPEDFQWPLLIPTNFGFVFLMNLDNPLRRYYFYK